MVDDIVTVFRLVIAFLLGGIIGLVGSALKPSAQYLGLLTIAVGLVMIFLGLKLVEIFPALRECRQTSRFHPAATCDRRVLRSCRIWRIGLEPLSRVERSRLFVDRCRKKISECIHRPF